MAQVLKITLVRSHIGRIPAHRAVLKGLGLNRCQQSVELQDTPEVRGMIRKVAHLLKVEE
jgi:large subunit ribosomal protein L30